MSHEPAQDEPPPDDLPPDGEKVDNNDMNMRPQSLVGMEEHVRAAMSSEKIKSTFYHFEVNANRTKRWHNILGACSLSLLILVLEFALVKVVSPRFGIVDFLEPLNVWAVILGIIPGVCGGILHLCKVREHWVLARFKAERIRHWKFQQLLDGPYLESLTSDSDAFGPRWQRLMDELDAGKGRMHDYVRNLPFVSAFVHHHNIYRPFASTAIFRSAAAVYQQFRLEVQLGWFNQESERYQQADRRTENLAGTLLVLSILSAFLEGILHFFPRFSVSLYVDPGLSVAGIGMALLSAGVRVYRSASGISESAERYQRLTAQLNWHRDNYTRILDKDEHDSTSQEELYKVMVDIERLCHGELVEFVRVSEKSDYFF